MTTLWAFCQISCMWRTVHMCLVLCTSVCAVADSESETPNDLAPPPVESHPTSASSANQTMAAQDGISGSCPEEGQSTLEHTRPGEILQEKVRAVPSRWCVIKPIPPSLRGFVWNGGAVWGWREPMGYVHTRAGSIR